jgi:hypothetical protein
MSEITDAFEEIGQSIFSEKFIIGGKQITGIFANVDAMTQMMVGSSQARSDATFRATKSQFESVPAQKGEATRMKDGTTWSIFQVNVDEVAHYAFVLRRQLK